MVCRNLVHAARYARTGTRSLSSVNSGIYDALIGNHRRILLVIRTGCTARRTGLSSNRCWAACVTQHVPNVHELIEGGD